jgi:hypothetical protein
MEIMLLGVFFFHLRNISSVAYQRGSLRARLVAILSWGGMDTGSRTAVSGTEGKFHSFL